MSISYPLALPTHTGIRSVEFRAVNAVAYSMSPFTFAGQAFAFPGQMWQIDITLSPRKRADAERWVAWLVSLFGQYGTFLIGDPLSTAPRGTAEALTVTGSAGSNTVTATVANGDTLLAGDMFQLGTGGDATMHKVLVDYTGTGSGTNLEIWPALRKNRSAVSANLTNPQGVFRLVNNDPNWSVRNIETYGITFGAMEAI